MRTRELEHPPRILPLYARAAAPLLPGASRLPWVGGNGGEMPDLELTVGRVSPARERVAAYAALCGFAPGEQLPPSYCHVLAFPLHLALMADGRFPFAAIGLVHLANEIEQRRALGLGERLELRVRASTLQAHSRGESFAILTEVRSEGELVWRARSTMLHRGARAAAAAPARSGARETRGGSFAPAASWSLAADLGRRYAAVSGDRNPIHMTALAARALGFPRAIAHGMWTKARCLAALRQEGKLPADEAFRVEVSFRRAILLPADVEFHTGTDGAAVAFEVRGEGGETHLDGRLLELAGRAAGHRAAPATDREPKA